MLDKQEQYVRLFNQSNSILTINKNRRILKVSFVVFQLVCGKLARYI